MPPGLDVTVYPVMAVPPSDAGALNVMLASLLVPAVAVPIVGAPGVVHVVTLLDADEADDVPIAFVAVTVNVYEVLLDKPLTDIGDEAPVPVMPPGLDVAVYWLIADPPLSSGPVNDTETVPAAELDAEPIVGAPGTVFGKGHPPPDTCCKACVDVYEPEAEPDLPPVTVGRVLLIKPPNQRLDIS